MITAEQLIDTYLSDGLFTQKDKAGRRTFKNLKKGPAHSKTKGFKPKK